MEEANEKNITKNRKARHEYHILQTYEAGIVLKGTEVKSLREGKISLADSYVRLKKGEAWLLNVHINEYEQGNRFNHDPTRERKLLLHKSEIRKLEKAVHEKGNTIIPLRFYFKEGKVKVEVAIARGKKVYDKREDIAKRDIERETNRRIKY